jgi:hypothetical protein
MTARKANARATAIETVIAKRAAAFAVARFVDE